MSHDPTDAAAVGPRSADRDEILADTTELLAASMREIAELNWSAYALGELPNLSVSAQVHEQLLMVRRLLAEADYTPPPLASGRKTMATGIPYAVCRNIVETDSLIRALRTHAGEIRKIMKRTLQRKDSPLPPDEQALRLADFLAPIVREMIRNRNRRAREFGSQDYAALTADSIGLDLEQLKEWLIEVSDALGGCIASGPSPPSPHDNRHLVYHEEVGQRLEEAEPLVVLNDENLPALAKMLGVDPSRLSKDLQTAPEMDGWCLSVDRPDEVRLVLTREKPLALGLVLHELGHYLHETAPAPKGWQLLAPPHIFDETMASLLELGGCSSSELEQFIIRPASKQERLLHAAQQRKWALSALFELEAYQSDAESLDSLWQDVMHKAGFTTTFPHEWALDGFYVDDPLYRFNYVVGALWSADELCRMKPRSLKDVAQRIRELGQAAYQSHWRSVLNLEKSLPEASAYIGWVQKGGF